MGDGITPKKWIITAWIAPTDEIEKLSKIFPELTIDLESKHYEGNIIQFTTIKIGETLELGGEPLFDEEDEDWDEEEENIDQDTI
jgi:hypothetical protein